LANLLSSLAKKAAERATQVYDQVNVLDNGRTYQQRTPTNNRSTIGQLTHNGATNTVGNIVVKPVVATEQAAYNLGALGGNYLTGMSNTKTKQQLGKHFDESIPGFFANNAKYGGQAAYNLAFKAPVLDIIGKGQQAEQARLTGIQEFNKTVAGQATHPIQYGIANATHASKQDQAETGLDPNATGAQKFFADPVMGTLGAYGLAKGGGAGLKKTVETGKVVADNVKPLNQGGYIQIPGVRPELSDSINNFARTAKNHDDFVAKSKDILPEMDTKKFFGDVQKEVGLEKEIQRVNPNLSVNPADSPAIKNVTLLGAKQQLSKNIQDTGNKMFGSKKDIAKLRTIGRENLSYIESQGERAAANLVTKERVLGEKSKYEPNLTGDPALEQIRHTLLSAIPKRPGASAEARQAYVDFMPKFAETVRSAAGKEELVDKVINEFRRSMSFSDRQQLKKHFGAKFYNVISGNSEAIRRAMYRPAQDFAWAEKKTVAPRDPNAPAAPQLHGGELVPYERQGNMPRTTGDPKQIRDAYNFKGLEYGNYVKDAEAREHLGRFGESMHDIGEVANMNMPDLIKQMNLGIGFGSRGGGKALAHYEPSNKVINITKKSGADGTLGHEFAHALDDFLGSGKVGRDEYASAGRSSNPAVNQAMQQVMKTIKEGNTRITIEAKEGGAKGFNYPAVRMLLQKHNGNAQAAIDDLMTQYPGTKGTVLDKAVQYALAESGAKSVEVPVKRSPFYAAAENQGDYWKRDTELFARVFADYLRAKSQAQGIRNNYMARTEPGGPLFSPENMQDIMPAMDNLLGTIKKEYNIADAPPPQAMPKPVAPAPVIEQPVVAPPTKAVVAAPAPQPKAPVAAVPAIKPLDESGHILIKDAKTPPPEAPTAPSTPPTSGPQVVQNRLTKGGKDGRQNISPETQEQISGEHNVRNTQKLQDEAVANADKAGLDGTVQAAHEALATPLGKIDDQTVALVQQAIERADQTGRHEDAVALHDGLSEHLVKQGQTIQAASLLYRLSPQGQFYKAMRDLKKGGAEITPELETKLRQQVENIKTAAEGDAKVRATAEFHKTVVDNLPKGGFQSALSVWKAGLLSGSQDSRW
jgi:hypothetical protein